jgi:hypothetical protein
VTNFDLRNSFHPEDGDDKFLRNMVCNKTPMAKQTRRRHFSTFYFLVSYFSFYNLFFSLSLLLFFCLFLFAVFTARDAVGMVYNKHSSPVPLTGAFSVPNERLCGPYSSSETSVTFFLKASFLIAVYHGRSHSSQTSAVRWP